MSDGSEEVAGAAERGPGVPSERRARRWPWVLFGVAIALGGAYAAGRLQTAKLVELARADLAKQEKVTQDRQAELAAAEKKLQRLEARRRLDLALRSLDQRNFGIAEQELRAAATLLERGDGGARPALARLGAEIKGFRLTATEDVGAQRGRVLDWSRRFDQAEPPAAP